MTTFPIQMAERESETTLVSLKSVEWQQFDAKTFLPKRRLNHETRVDRKIRASDCQRWYRMLGGQENFAINIQAE